MIDMWVCNSVPLCWIEKWKHTWMKHSVWALLRWAIWRTSDLQIVSRASVRWHALFDLHVWGGNSCLFMSFYVSVLCLMETLSLSLYNYIYTFFHIFIYLFVNLFNLHLTSFPISLAVRKMALQVIAFDSWGRHWWLGMVYCCSHSTGI